MPDLSGKIAIVTGGSKGIGRAIAAALAAAGADVVVTSRNEDEARTAAKEIAELGQGRTLGLGADVRDYEAVKTMVGETVKALGGLDILIANAGVGAFAPIDEMDAETWNRVIDTNLTGVFYSCREAIPELKKRGGGWIITIGSVAGRYTMPGGTAYNASKWGLRGFTEALMLDVRHHGIRVSTIMPGTVDTYFNDNLPSGESWKLAPADVARVVIQLLEHDPRSLPSKIEIRPSQPPRR
ncbi:MAG: SDR family oxidoreductase [Candidatus Palauibacterales bacterium]|nr:SDR family oxidoreductase [Candidatus Palauibacterales bacterium]